MSVPLNESVPDKIVAENATSLFKATAVPAPFVPNSDIVPVSTPVAKFASPRTSAFTRSPVPVGSYCDPIGLGLNMNPLP